MKRVKYYNAADANKLERIEYLDETGLLRQVDHYEGGVVVQTDLFDADGQLIPPLPDPGPGTTEELPPAEGTPAAGTDPDA